MAVRTKPVRIFEADAGALRLIAEIEGRQQAQVMHVALAEYMTRHRDQLADVFTRAQKAFEAGDIEALAKAMSASGDRQVDELVAQVAAARKSA
jgi:hypothetical protein